MDAKTILNFKSTIVDFSLEELNDMRSELQLKLANMVMDEEVIMKLAIVEDMIEEKGAKLNG